MMSSVLEFKVQAVLLLVEALVYLGLAAWCFNRGRAGGWALFAALGAFVVGVVLAVTAAASAELVQHLGTVLVVARLLGVLLLIGGVVQSRRTPPVPTGSIYGS